MTCSNNIPSYHLEKRDYYLPESIKSVSVDDNGNAEAELFSGNMLINGKVIEEAWHNNWHKTYVKFGQITIIIQRRI